MIPKLICSRIFLKINQEIYTIKEELILCLSHSVCLWIYTCIHNVYVCCTWVTHPCTIYCINKHTHVFITSILIIVDTMYQCLKNKSSGIATLPMKPRTFTNHNEQMFPHEGSPDYNLNLFQTRVDCYLSHISMRVLL